MIVVIQCAARKQRHAGHLRTPEGRDVLFVAQPDAAAPQRNRAWARPDDLADGRRSWRTVLQEYNAAPGGNLLGLLPAWRLYTNPAYEMLGERFAPDRMYVLSAGWGLIRADYLTPKYDITFSKARNVDPFKCRGHRESYEDFCLPSCSRRSSSAKRGGALPACSGPVPGPAPRPQAISSTPRRTVRCCPASSTSRRCLSGHGSTVSAHSTNHGETFFSAVAAPALTASHSSSVHGGADNRTLRASGAGLDPERCGADHRDHRRELGAR